MSRKNKQRRTNARAAQGSLADSLRSDPTLSAFTFEGPYRLSGPDLLD
ncbi:TPA: phage portal protein, partial [Escherichia coli]